MPCKTKIIRPNRSAEIDFVVSARWVKDQGGYHVVHSINSRRGSLHECDHCTRYCTRPYVRFCCECLAHLRTQESGVDHRPRRCALCEIQAYGSLEDWKQAIDSYSRSTFGLPALQLWDIVDNVVPPKPPANAPEDWQDAWRRHPTLHPRGWDGWLSELMMEGRYKNEGRTL